MLNFSVSVPPHTTVSNREVIVLYAICKLEISSWTMNFWKDQNRSWSRSHQFGIQLSLSRCLNPELSTTNTCEHLSNNRVTVRAFSLLVSYLLVLPLKVLPKLWNHPPFTPVGQSWDMYICPFLQVNLVISLYCLYYKVIIWTFNTWGVFEWCPQGHLEVKEGRLCDPIPTLHPSVL